MKHCAAKQFIVAGLIAHITLLAVSCQANYLGRATLSDSEVLTALPNGEIGSPVWLRENLVAFTYRPNESDGSPWDNRIGILTFNNREWRELPLPKGPEACSLTAPTSVGNLRRLPSGDLGFIFECDLKSRGVKTLLYAWDVESNSLQMLYEFEPYFRATWFTFASNMTEFVQARGSGTDDQLYFVNQRGETEQILSNFQRVNRPSWSLDGKTIAFIGTESYPGGKPDDFTTYEQLRRLLFYPWDIYLMNSDESDVRLILPGIEEPGDVQWVPESSRLLTFQGNFKNKPGVWILDIETRQVTRIWPHRTSYSWSLDGKQMIVFEKYEENGSERSSPVIIDVAVEMQ